MRSYTIPPSLAKKQHLSVHFLLKKGQHSFLHCPIGIYKNSHINVNFSKIKIMLRHNINAIVSKHL